MQPAAPNDQAPDTYRVRFETSKGAFVVAITRDWAPLGADRFYNLAKSGFFDGARFFRVLKGFVVQFGLAADPATNQPWSRISDDPVRQSNRRGSVTFATAGPNTRTTQVFINLGQNGQLDGMGFAPIGAVTDGMETVDGLYDGYGEGGPHGRGPDQSRIRAQGNTYLGKDFPLLDYIRRAAVE